MSRVHFFNKIKHFSLDIRTASAILVTLRNHENWSKDGSTRGTKVATM